MDATFPELSGDVEPPPAVPDDPLLATLIDWVLGEDREDREEEEAPPPGGAFAFANTTPAPPVGAAANGGQAMSKMDARRG